MSLPLYGSKAFREASGDTLRPGGLKLTAYGLDLMRKAGLPEGDGCNPIQIFFKIVFPILKPTMISTAILETMWVWNDYLLPTLVLDIKKYRTIPMAIQYFRGGYGRVELAPMMACIIIAIIPIIILYMTCQKYIIEGVVAGAVKG